MKFESAASAANLLNCTVRAIQKWAKEGKIPCAYKDGRDWKIPTDAVRPDGDEPPRFYNEPFPIVHIYNVGEIEQYIESVANIDDKNMTLCEYYYFTGRLKDCVLTAEPYLTSKNPILRSSAALFFLFANLCEGHTAWVRFAAEIISEEFEKSMLSDENTEVKAITVLFSMIIKMQLHLPIENIPPMSEHMRYLDEGVRLFACYLSAYAAYLEKDYQRSLGIVETALAFSENLYPVSMIYLYIIGAMDYINLLDTKKAIDFIEKAWSLSSPDGMFMPFVEHYNLLQGLIEKQLKKNHPEDYKRIIAAAKQYNLSWYEVYNESGERLVAANLSHTEFTIAMLYSRNWRAKEIAAHMELSERTIMNYITLIYDKLGINGKKELEKYMLR